MALQARKVGENPGRKDHYRQVVNSKGRWTRQVALVEEALEDPLRWRGPKTIFVNSMSDLFHPEVPATYIQKVFSVMAEAHWHNFQVLTKRPERAAELAVELPWPENVWMGTSVENAEVLHRVSSLREIPAAVLFLSLEPLLGPLPKLNLQDIDWIIVGGESGPFARSVDPTWVRDLRDQALRSDVSFFFKQWGGKNKKAAGRKLDGRIWNQMPSKV